MAQRHESLQEPHPRIWRRGVRRNTARVCIQPFIQRERWPIQAENAIGASS